jgi:hypothetical protein
LHTYLPTFADITYAITTVSSIFVFPLTTGLYQHSLYP